MDQSECIFCHKLINEPEEQATVLIFHGQPIPAHESCYNKLEQADRELDDKWGIYEKI